MLYFPLVKKWSEDVCNVSFHFGTDYNDLLDGDSSIDNLDSEVKGKPPGYKKVYVSNYMSSVERRKVMTQNSNKNFTYTGNTQ